MTYVRPNTVGEQQEACRKAEQITAICEDLHITLDPIDWQEYGLQAPVKVHNIEIASLRDLCQRESNDILRHIQIKLFEHAALETMHARPGLKAVMWSPVEVAQPQEFLSLWIITLETDERIPIVESLKNEQRVYEYYTFDGNDKRQLTALFGPASEGEYPLGENITIKERDRQFTGEIIYIIPPGKVVTNRKYVSRGYHSMAGTTYTNEVAARYIVDCHDGFPHIVNQSQVVR
jgi:hypothetical protein